MNNSMTIKQLKAWLVREADKADTISKDTLYVNVGMCLKERALTYRRVLAKLKKGGK